MNKKNNQLKMLANLAKQRLLNKDYSEPPINNFSCKTVSNYFIKNAMGLKKLTAETEFVSIKNTEDESFIKKVITLLEENDLLYNPLGQLTDTNYYNTLNNEQKQFYMLRLSEKYNKIKEMYDKNTINILKIG